MMMLTEIVPARLYSEAFGARARAPLEHIRPCVLARAA
jgi:hypothetical protein